MAQTHAPTRPDAAAVSRFFADFDDAFARFDGNVIARRYAEPYMACRADGTSEVYVDAAATGRYFGSIVNTYYEMGVRSCTHRDLDVVDVGGRHLLATVTWDLLDEAGSVVISWRESYVLVTLDGKLLARASIDFADQ